MAHISSDSAGNSKLTNWAGNICYSAERVHHATSAEDARAYVVGSARFKALGSRHCFNDIADSAGVALSLELLQGMSLDAAHQTVTVGAGVKYGQLGPFLDEKGFALHNLASLPHISVVGACATATHGSGERNGNLATAVSALDLITADGDLVKLDRSSAEFRAAVVGLGALGVITRMTLDVEPRFEVRQHVYLDLPLRSVEQHFDAIQASGYSVSLFTDWRNRNITELWIKTRTDRPSSAAPDEYLGAKLATVDVHPIAGISAENCTEQRDVPGPWYDRLPHFRMGFTPSAGKELQTEYLVARADALDAILAVARLSELVSPHLLVCEIRTVAEDDLWMSTAYGRPSVAIHFTWEQDCEAIGRILPVIEKELKPYRARPHWGKLFHRSAGELRPLYERFDDFLDVARRYDRKGKFRNAFLARNVFGGAS